MPAINADEIADQIDKPANHWTPRSLRDAFVSHGCAVVRGAVSLEDLSDLQALINQAYQNTTDIHVYGTDLAALTEGKVTGFELADAPLLQGFLKEVYAGQSWQRDSVTARRIQGADPNHNWQEPLELHIDSQFHKFQFTINFWIPFQECGVDAPSLQLIPLGYVGTRRYAGFNGNLHREGEQWHFGYFAQHILRETALQSEFGDNYLFRPPMNPGDVIISSNWVIHGTYHTPRMKLGRTSVEIRFVGEKHEI